MSLDVVIPQRSMKWNPLHVEGVFIIKGSAIWDRFTVEDGEPLSFSNLECK